MVNDEP
jgi:uncharacterized membrane protein YukC